jgi:hypothetical protein
VCAVRRAAWIRVGAVSPTLKEDKLHLADQPRQKVLAWRDNGLGPFRRDGNRAKAA